MKALVLAIGLLVGITQVCVAEEYLYWYVSQTDAPEEDRVPFNFAVLKVWEKKNGDSEPTLVYVPDDVYSDWTTAIGSGPKIATKADTECKTPIGAYADKEDASYYYQLELWNFEVSDDDPVWTSKLLVSYESLVESRLDKDKADDGYTVALPWNAIGPAPVPEPTGGTLALLGLALLGLRRKRFGMSEAAT